MCPRYPVESNQSGADQLNFVCHMLQTFSQQLLGMMPEAAATKDLPFHQSLKGALKKLLWHVMSITGWSSMVFLDHDLVY